MTTSSPVALTSVSPKYCSLQRGIDQVFMSEISNLTVCFCVVYSLEAAEFIPRVEHADREKLEAEAYQYFADHPEMNHTYSGFMGQEPSPDDPNKLSYQNRSVQPFYYLLQFAEPFVPGVYHYDLYSPPWEQPTIQTAIDTWKPALTGRFLL